MKTIDGYAADCPPVSVIMDLVAQLGIKDGVTPLRAPWERAIDERWTICLNPLDAPHKWRGFTIPRFHCALEYNGFPAGLINPYEGTLAAGREANEDALIAALKRALAADPSNRSAPTSESPRA